MTAPDRLRLGYGLNGFAGHRMEDALEVVAGLGDDGLGYEGVGLTLDLPHLDPFAPGLVERTAQVGQLLARHGIAVVVETGSRYVLDPWRKHEPTLVSDSGRHRRVDLLRRAIEVAADLGAEAVSFWSGTTPPGVSEGEAWSRLLSGVEEVLAEAERQGVTLAFEPEPGMFVDTLAGVQQLRSRLGDPERLCITVDVGHLRCNEDDDPASCIESVGPLIANVQVDDMRRGVHEHLEIGAGEVDFVAVIAALRAVGYRGLANVELPRQSHAAPEVAARTLQALREAEERSLSEVGARP